MARSTYHDQFERLVDKGYLVQSSGNGFDFFEVPQPRHDNIQKPVSAVGLNFEECPSTDTRIERPGQPVLPENTEINNREMPDKPRTNISGLEITEEIKVPEVKEIRIPVPKIEPKKEITSMPKKGEFVF